MVKKKKNNSTRLALLLSVFITATMVLGAITLRNSTEVRSQAAKNKVTEEPKMVTHTYMFNTTATMISIPGESAITAKDLCQTEHLVAVSRLSNHVNGTVQDFDCSDNFPGSNISFNLEPHVGYIVYTSNPTQAAITYHPTRQEVGYTPNHDFIGLSNFGNRARASDVCARFLEAGHPLESISIQRVPNWVEYYCEYPDQSDEDFVIEKHVGYWISNGMFERPSLPTQYRK